MFSAGSSDSTSTKNGVVPQDVPALTRALSHLSAASAGLGGAFNAYGADGSRKLSVLRLRTSELVPAPEFMLTKESFPMSDYLLDSLCELVKLSESLGLAERMREQAEKLAEDDLKRRQKGAHAHARNYVAFVITCSFRLLGVR